MINWKIINKVAATVAATGMLCTGILDIAKAATLLNNGEVNGFIRVNSPPLRYRNQSTTGSPIQRAPGDEYILNAQQGDTIQASVQVGDNSDLSPVLVLISSRTGRQVAYDDTNNSLQYQVPAAGEYRLLVLGQNNSGGRYSLDISGLSANTGNTVSPTQASQADRVMRDVLQLRAIGCGVPNVATITIGSERRCTRDVDPGQYTYDPTSKSINLADANGQTATDDKKKLLQDQYGLRVLNSCPVNRSSVVSISFNDSNQTSTYCATPNRLIQAGQYTYNASTGNLDPATNRPQCTITVAGNCIVK
jgi:hypothetical protein